jgi:Cu/Ag efflux pump CusA
MGGLVVTLVSFTVLVALLVAALVLVTVAPVFVALQMADARRFSTTRWLVVSVLTVVAGVGYAYLLHKHTHVPTVVALLPLALTWAGPGALWLLEAGQTRLGGVPGRHE